LVIQKCYFFIIELLSFWKSEWGYKKISKYAYGTDYHL
jgi:hypothetical protein